MTSTLNSIANSKGTKKSRKQRCAISIVWCVLHDYMDSRENIQQPRMSTVLFQEHALPIANEELQMVFTLVGRKTLTAVCVSGGVKARCWGYMTSHWQWIGNMPRCQQC
jgi:hypothetical protein